MSLYDVSDIDPSTQLSDATLAALDLPQQPFDALEPNSTSYSDETTAEQLADVKQALITGDDLLLMLGQAGAGKTVMLKQLGEHSGVRIQCFAVKGSNRFSTMNLFAGLLEAFKQPPPEKLQDILDSLIPYLQTMISRNTLSVIVLDDAHLVNEAELTQLLSGMLYINSHEETVLRIAMAAPPEFEDRIPDLLPEGADLPYSSLTITGMSAPRAADFIEFRMQQAGLRGEHPFSDAEVANLVEQSGGLPGPLQIAAVDALNEQYGPVKRDLAAGVASDDGGFLQSRFAKITMGLLASLLILFGILMFLPDKPSNEATRYTVSTTQPVELKDDDELNTAQNESAAQISTARDASAGSSGGASTDITAPSTSTGPVATSPTENVEPEAEESIADSSTNSNAASDTSSTPIVIVAAPETEETESEESSQTSNSAGTPTPTATTEDTASRETEESDSPQLIGALESSSWILLQDRELYTVQMSASRDRQSVVNFLNTHAETLSAPNSIYTFARNGSNWYALLHGLYESIDEARTAVEAMPPAALSNQPWIRSVARVQDVLKAQ